MRDGDFDKIQSAIRAAVNEPAGAPADVVARTARRCEAVLAGRESEARLKSGEALPEGEVYSLVAAGLLGQLALGNALPPNGDISAMTRELAASDWLKSRLTGTAQDALLALHSGKLMPENTQQTKVAAPAQKPGTVRGL